eukprot:1150554-Pelagomonas_calceolata.AAC.3
MSGSGASGFGRGIGTAPSSGFGQNRGRREAVDRLRGVASRLMLPAGVVQEAVSMFHEAHATSKRGAGSCEHDPRGRLALLAGMVQEAVSMFHEVGAGEAGHAAC